MHSPATNYWIASQLIRTSISASRASEAHLGLSDSRFPRVLHAQEEILAEYPGLSALDIQACLAYGAEMSRERHVPIPIASPA